MNNARRLTEGAVLLAIYTVLLLGSMYVPLLSLLTTFVLPLPFIIFTMRHTLKYAMVLLIAAAFVTLVVSSPLSILNTLMSGLTGIVIGWMYQRGKGQIETLLASTVVILLNFILLYAISVQFLNVDMIRQLQTTMDQSFEQAQKFTAISGGESNEKVIEQFKSTMKLIQYVIPVLFVMGSAVLAVLTQLVITPILKRLRYQVPAWPAFREIRLPRHLLLLYIVILLLSIFARPAEGSFLYTALLNLNIIFQFLTALHGLALIAYFLHAKGFGKALPILAAVLGLFIPMLFSVYSFLGIIDLGFSLRRFIKQV